MFLYGWDGNLMGVPPESAVVEIRLNEHDGRTILELTHRQLPPDVSSDHERGWVHFLAILATVARRQQYG